jgi:outer membrane lipoprotein carrier protein
MKYILLAALAALSPLSARAYEPDATALADIMAVEQYLNRLNSFQAAFEQFVPGSPFSEGMFYLKRPGKFLWQYTRPTPHKLITDGGQIFYEDGETKQVTQVPRGGLTELLGKRTLRLMGGDIRVIDHARDGDLLAVTVQLDKTADDAYQGGTRVQFVFEQEPLRLKQLTTSNQLGQDVVVSFNDIKENIPLSNSLFRFVPPHYDDGF